MFTQWLGDFSKATKSGSTSQTIETAPSDLVVQRVGGRWISWISWIQLTSKVLQTMNHQEQPKNLESPLLTKTGEQPPGKFGSSHPQFLAAINFCKSQLFCQFWPTTANHDLSGWIFDRFQLGGDGWVGGVFPCVFGKGWCYTWGWCVCFLLFSNRIFNIMS